MWIFLVLALWLPRWAAADDATPVKRLFMSGSKHFDLGEYREALSDFKQGFRLNDDPVFLYNIAQCHRLLNENAEAIRSYKVYLRRRPDAPNRAEVEQKIAGLEAAIAEQQAATTAPPNHVLPPDRSATSSPPVETTVAPPATVTAAAGVTTRASRADSTPVYKKWWPWTIVGGVVLVGVGVGLGVGLSRGGSSAGSFPAVQF
jgi:tetratricopeptide (TPR) repeat protein